MTATTKLHRAQLSSVLSRQHDVITRAQAMACGMTDKALRHRTRSGGPWRQLLRGVYLAQTGAPEPDQLDVAALLYTGPGSVLTGHAALWRFGLKASHPARVDVLLPAASKRMSTGFVRVYRSARVPELHCVDGAIRFVLPARAVADAARGLTTLRGVRALVAESVQRQWCSLTELSAELAQGPVVGSALFRQVLAEVTGGIRSSAEGDFSDLVTATGLPVPMYNARLFAGNTLLAVADAWWPAAGVAAEVDSREWHLSPDDWERALARHAKMTAAGILVLHFTPRQVRTDATQVAATIKAALDGAATRPRPRIRALPATA
jgi:putative AbiEi antitoxin of type IV toxin-antitoxin system